MNKTGKTLTQSELVLSAVRRYPGCTMPELAARSGVDYEIIHRRMKGLKDAKQVRYKDIGGWFVEVWPVFQETLF